MDPSSDPSKPAKKKKKKAICAICAPVAPAEWRKTPKNQWRLLIAYLAPESVKGLLKEMRQTIIGQGI